MISSNIKKSFVVNLFIVLLIFWIDRFSKLYVIYLYNKLTSTEIFTSKFLNIQLIWNEGVAFGLFAFDNKSYYNSLTILILIITIIVLYFVIKTRGIDRYGFPVTSLVHASISEQVQAPRPPRPVCGQARNS